MLLSSRPVYTPSSRKNVLAASGAGRIRSPPVRHELIYRMPLTSVLSCAPLTTRSWPAASIASTSASLIARLIPSLRAKLRIIAAIRLSIFGRIWPFSDISARTSSTARATRSVSFAYASGLAANHASVCVRMLPLLLYSAVKALSSSPRNSFSRPT